MENRSRLPQQICFQQIFYCPAIPQTLDQKIITYTFHLLYSHPDNVPVRRCWPKCDPSCINGRCIEATTCQCNAGYQMRNGSRNHCDPVCTPSCENGECIDADRCRCWAGFEPNDEVGARPNQCRELCQPGYKRVPGGRCIPICSLPCQNGDCVLPDVCACLAGYRKNLTSANVCDPVCDKPLCVNGVCVAPNRCECADGYEQDAQRRRQCEPVCNGGCAENAACVGPNQCECIDGYTVEDSGQCLPVCTHGCRDGRCTAPDRCECPDGYGLHLHDQSEAQCVPECRLDCGEGWCAQPDRCECANGLEWSDGACVCPEGWQRLNDECVLRVVTTQEPTTEMQTTEAVTEEATTVSTEAPTEMPTTVWTDPPTETQTKVSTELPKEIPTTEQSTEEPTNVQTETTVSETFEALTDSQTVDIFVTTTADRWTVEIMPPDQPKPAYTEHEATGNEVDVEFETITERIRGELHFVSFGSVSHAHWLYAIILTAVALAVVIVAAIVWYRKVDYNVKKSGM